MKIRMSFGGLALLLIAGGLFAAEESPAAKVVIYTKDKSPAIPKLEELPLKESISQHGITWTFEQPARAGRFVNGDWYVVGPATVKTIDPKPLFGKEVPESELDGNDKKSKDGQYIRNGSVVNQPPRREMGYDSGVRIFYKPELNAVLPIALKPGYNLISTISLKKGEVAEVVGYGNSSRSRCVHDNCPIKMAAILTCVAEPLPPDTFRPAYGDRSQTLYYARNLKRELLPKLARVKDAKDPVKFADVFQRLWLNVGFFGFDEPMENMPHYGQQVSQAVSAAGCLLCLDFTPEEKEPLLVNFVQAGIDYWGLVKNGHPGWAGFGGHTSGRKFPIVFAGYMLGDEKMMAPGKEFPKVEFGEDNQTYYGECWTGAKVVFTGHGAISTATGKVMQEKTGPYEHMHPSLWNRNGRKDHTSENYRRNNTSCAWVGEALVLRILKLEDAWAHDAFFDYMDRWMTEDDKPFRKVLGKPDKEFCCEGNPGESFIGEMWAKYRSLSSAPTDGWKTLKPNPNGIVLPKFQPGDAKTKPSDNGNGKNGKKEENDTEEKQ